MTQTFPPEPNLDTRVPRTIADIGGNRSGPTLIVIGSLHGNEPAGVRAIERVARRLAERPPPMRGRMVGLAGNRAALARGERYLDVDLNRCWTADTIVRLRTQAQGPDDPAELEEAAELLDAIEAARADRGPTYVLDLHTTSGPSAPFAVLADTLTNRRFAMALGLPVILGLEEQLDGTLLSFLETIGFVTTGCEGGLHHDPASVDYLASALWLALAAAGILSDPATVPEVRAARRTLAEAGRAVPSVAEIRYRHAVGPDDGFRMKPGYLAFETIAAGQVMAHDRSGEIKAPISGRLMLPLYQAQGSDGFFIARAINPVWLGVSSLARRLGLGAIAHWLPGVSAAPGRPDLLVIDRHWAGWYALEVFHLLGYRRIRADGGKLVVTRRREARP